MQEAGCMGDWKITKSKRLKYTPFNNNYYIKMTKTGKH